MILQTMPNGPALTKSFATPISTGVQPTVFTLPPTDWKTNVKIIFETLTQAHRALTKRPEWEEVEYRQGYLEGAIEQGIAWQIRANRQRRGMSQETLAKSIGTAQSAVSRAEDPEYGAHSLETLLKMAHAFDCALSLKFIPYSELAIESEDLRPDALVATSFAEEIKQLSERKYEISGTSIIPASK